MTINTIFARIESKTFAVKDAERRGGARFGNSRDMQMPRYSSYRDTVGTEYTFMISFEILYSFLCCTSTFYGNNFLHVHLIEKYSKYFDCFPSLDKIA